MLSALQGLLGRPILAVVHLRLRRRPSPTCVAPRDSQGWTGHRLD